MLLPITLTAAAALALLNIWLSVRVSTVRIKTRTLHGDGGHPVMLKRMRAHSNFIENAPFFLILLGLLELSGGWSMLLWGAVILFVLARIFHAFGMDKDKPNILRAGGVAITMLVIAALAVWGVIASYDQVNTSIAPRQQAPAIKG